VCYTNSMKDSTCWPFSQTDETASAMCYTDFEEDLDEPVTLAKR